MKFKFLKVLIFQNINLSVISIEYLDLNMKKLEFKNNDVNNLLNSDLYKYFIQNNYFFVNWFMVI